MVINACLAHHSKYVTLFSFLLLYIIRENNFIHNSNYRDFLLYKIIYNNK